MLFYRNLLGAAFDLAPDVTMRAVCDVVKTFQMPGHTIENFGRKSVQIAMAGIYDLRIHHDEVVMPILRQLNVIEARPTCPPTAKPPARSWPHLCLIWTRTPPGSRRRARASRARAAARL